MHFGDICHAVGQEATEKFLVCENLPIIIATTLLGVVCKSGWQVGGHETQTRAVPVSSVLFPFHPLSPVSLLSRSPRCLPATPLQLSPVLEPVKIQSLVAIQAPSQVSLLLYLQSPYICPLCWSRRVQLWPHICGFQSPVD